MKSYKVSDDCSKCGREVSHTYLTDDLSKLCRSCADDVGDRDAKRIPCGFPGCKLAGAFKDPATGNNYCSEGHRIKHSMP